MRKALKKNLKKLRKGRRNYFKKFINKNNNETIRLNLTKKQNNKKPLQKEIKNKNSLNPSDSSNLYRIYVDVILTKTNELEYHVKIKERNPDAKEQCNLTLEKIKNDLPNLDLKNGNKELKNLNINRVKKINDPSQLQSKYELFCRKRSHSKHSMINKKNEDQMKINTDIQQFQNTEFFMSRFNPGNQKETADIAILNHEGKKN
jgi:hypothetical protein